MGFSCSQKFLDVGSTGTSTGNKRGGGGGKKDAGKKDDEGYTGNKVQRLATAAAADPELYAQYRAEMKAQRVVHQLSSDSNRRFSFPSLKFYPRTGLRATIVQQMEYNSFQVNFQPFSLSPPECQMPQASYVLA